MGCGQGTGFPRQESETMAIVDEKTYHLLTIVRRALIMILGALEDYLQMERSITPRTKR